MCMCLCAARIFCMLLLFYAQLRPLLLLLLLPPPSSLPAAAACFQRRMTRPLDEQGRLKRRATKMLQPLDEKLDARMVDPYDQFWIDDE